MKPTTRSRVAIGALVAMQLSNAFGEALPLREVAESFGKTLLPPSLLPFLVVTKLLSALALVVPGRSQLKEWAFAGILIDVLGAAASYLLAGHPEAFGLKVVPLALLVWGAAYASFRAERRRVGAVPVEPGAHGLGRAASLTLAVFVFGAALGELLRVEPVMVSLRTIHYPEHILSILVVAKVLAVIALVVPGFPTLRTWAQAGLAFNFVGALCAYAFERVFLLPDVPSLVALLLLLAVSVRFGTKPAPRLEPAVMTDASVSGG